MANDKYEAANRAARTMHVDYGVDGWGYVVGLLGGGSASVLVGAALLARGGGGSLRMVGARAAHRLAVDRDDSSAYVGGEIGRHRQQTRAERVCVDCLEDPPIRIGTGQPPRAPQAARERPRASAAASDRTPPSLPSRSRR